MMAVSPTGGHWIFWTDISTGETVSSAGSVNSERQCNCESDDVAFAILAAAPPRRVGIIGDPGPDVLRAIRSVEGARVERLSAFPAPEHQSDLALLLAPRLPSGSVDTALIVVPGGPPPAGSPPGGSLTAAGLRSVFPYTTKTLDTEPQAYAKTVARLPGSLQSFEPLIRAGTTPYLVVSGRGRRLGVDQDRSGGRGAEDFLRDG